MRTCFPRIDEARPQKGRAVALRLPAGVVPAESSRHAPDDLRQAGLMLRMLWWVLQPILAAASALLVARRDVAGLDLHSPLRSWFLELVDHFTQLE
jgi:hypothetical protein